MEKCRQPSTDVMTLALATEACGPALFAVSSQGNAIGDHTEGWSCIKAAVYYDASRATAWSARQVPAESVTSSGVQIEETAMKHARDAYTLTKF